MTIEMWPLGRIVPYPKNARKIPQRAIDKVAASLREFGWQQPIVVDTAGVIVVGHTRLLAARQLGWTEVPVLVADKLTPAQIAAYRLMDNRSHEESGWNLELLGPELIDLKAMNFDLSLTGFELRELGKLVPEKHDDPPAEIDRAEELQRKWKVERGQVWEMGEHRLMCGDARKDIYTLLADAKVDLVVTDPPYGVGVDYGECKDETGQITELMLEILPTLRRFPVVLLTCGQPVMFNYPAPTWVLAWIHPAPSGGCPWGFCGLNPILAYGADPYLAKGLGRQPDTLVLAADRKGVEGHPTPKPLAVWEWLLKRGSPLPGETVLDCFLGSGTTMVAAQNLNRRCYGLEIEPKYCAVILERMTAMGLTPVRFQPIKEKHAARRSKQVQAV